MFTILMMLVSAWLAVSFKQFVLARLDYFEIAETPFWRYLDEPLELARDIWSLWGWRPEPSPLEIEKAEADAARDAWLDDDGA